MPTVLCDASEYKVITATTLTPVHVLVCKTIIFTKVFRNQQVAVISIHERALKHIYFIVNELEIGTLVRVQDFRKNHSISASGSEDLRGLAMCQHVLFVLDLPARTQPAVTGYAWPHVGLNTQIVGRQMYSGKWYSVCRRYKRTILGKIHRICIKVRVYSSICFKFTPVWSGHSVV